MSDMERSDNKELCKVLYVLEIVGRFISTPELFPFLSSLVYLFDIHYEIDRLNRPSLLFYIERLRYDADSEPSTLLLITDRASYMIHATCWPSTILLPKIGRHCCCTQLPFGVKQERLHPSKTRSVGPRAACPSSLYGPYGGWTCGA